MTNMEAAQEMTRSPVSRIMSRSPLSEVAEELLQRLAWR